MSTLGGPLIVSFSKCQGETICCLFGEFLELWSFVGTIYQAFLPSTTSVTELCAKLVPISDNTFNSGENARIHISCNQWYFHSIREAFLTFWEIQPFFWIKNTKIFFVGLFELSVCYLADGKFKQESNGIVLLNRTVRVLPNSQSSSSESNDVQLQ